MAKEKGKELREPLGEEQTDLKLSNAESDDGLRFLPTRICGRLWFRVMEKVGLPGSTGVTCRLHVFVAAALS